MKFVVVNTYIRDAQTLQVPKHLNGDDFEDFVYNADYDNHETGLGWVDTSNVEEYIGIIDASSEEEAISKCTNWNPNQLKAYPIE